MFLAPGATNPRYAPAVPVSIYLTNQTISLFRFRKKMIKLVHVGVKIVPIHRLTPTLKKIMEILEVRLEVSMYYTPSLGHHDS